MRLFGGCPVCFHSLDGFVLFQLLLQLCQGPRLAHLVEQLCLSYKA